MSKIIPYSTLLRQQHVSFLRHKHREYQEREEYLMGLRKLLFQVEGQMRQGELQQLEVFREMAEHFKVALKVMRSGGPKKITGQMGEVSGQSVKGENGI